jgi:glycosyltransferase involved in cell wall biosynthesis
LVAHNRYQNAGGEDAVMQAEITMLRSAGHAVTQYERSNEAIGEMGSVALARQTLWSSESYREVTRLIRTVQPDVIHTHNTFPLISGSVFWAAARAKVPVVQTLHNFRLLCAQAMFLRDGQVCEACLGKLPWRGVLRKCYRESTVQSAALVGMLALHRTIGTYRDKVTRYIALSEFSRDKFVQGGLPRDKIAVKPNFADIPPPGENPRAGALFVGRLSHEKGMQVLADALRTSRNPECTIIGAGLGESLFRGDARIRLLGWQDQEVVHRRMREAAYLLLPSVCYEQCPRALVEAFACGLPVIASRLGPLAELVEEGKTGLLFQAGSARELAEKIAFARANPQAMRQMGANARAEYEAKYTQQRNYQQLLSIYRDAIAARKSELALNYGIN